MTDATAPLNWKQVIEAVEGWLWRGGSCSCATC
jgi:hypothetical protein